jgi:hypothetical protein
MKTTDENIMTAVTAQSQSEPCVVMWFAALGGLTFRTSFDLSKRRFDGILTMVRMSSALVSKIVSVFDVNFDV